MSKVTKIPATLVEGVEFAADAEPGSIQYRVYGAVPDAMMFYTCPCGCASVGSIYVRPFPQKPFWSKMGERDQPTIQPSIGLNRGAQDEDVESDGYHWHGYLMDGVWHSVYEGRG